MAKTANTPEKPKDEVVKSEKLRYRVLRPILHGKIALFIGDLVDMHPKHAQPLVETSALAPHVIAEETSRLVQVPEEAVKPATDESIDAVGIKSELTAVEISSQATPNN